MRHILVNLLILLAFVSGSSAAVEQAEISRTINRELAAGNWLVFFKYHWVQPLIDEAETPEARRDAEELLRSLERDTKILTDTLKIASVSQPKVICSFGIGEYSLYLERFDIGLIATQGSVSLPTELVYVRRGDRWFVFNNDERLESNFALADIIQWRPVSGGSLKRPECMNQLKIGKGANNSFKPNPLRGSA